MLKVSLNELNLSLTLPSGQAFRWKKRKETTKGEVTWVGVVGEEVWALDQNPLSGHIKCSLLSDPLRTEIKAEPEPKAKRQKRKDDNTWLLRVKDYFQMSVPLLDLYEKWSESDGHFKAIGLKFPGIRMMRQDPVENLFSFICSSNNNISRISKMVEGLCLKYGQRLMDDPEFGPIHAFPGISALADPGVEQELRDLGFGYRAKFIQKTAQAIVKMSPKVPEKWLFELREKSYTETHEALLQLPGVGAKVADCVCLMSLDKHEAIPVDVHVKQIAAQHYLPHLAKNKSLTSKGYQEAGDYFRELFGPYAGWAQAVLFCADLKAFKEKTTKKTV